MVSQQRLQVWFLGVVILGVSSAGPALTFSFAQGTGAALPSKLTAEEKQFVRSIEKMLVTKLNSKDNPGDQGTWYVIITTEQVQTVTGSRSVRRPRRVGVQTQAAKVSDATVVQGRHNAALTVAQFLSKSNAAAAELKPPKVSAVNRKTAVAANRQWEFRAFATQGEANALRDKLKPAPKEQSRAKKKKK